MPEIPNDAPQPQELHAILQKAQELLSSISGVEKAAQERLEKIEEKMRILADAETEDHEKARNLVTK